MTAVCVNPKCGKPLVPATRLCNHQCDGEYRQMVRKAKHARQCRTCGKFFSPPKHKPSQQDCNRACYLKWIRVHGKMRRTGPPPTYEQQVAAMRRVMVERSGPEVGSCCVCAEPVRMGLNGSRIGDGPDFCCEKCEPGVSRNGGFVCG